MKGSSQFIDVTPHPRILGVLGDIEFAHWQCLAELVDNAFDEFQAAGESEVRPTVTITLPTANADRATSGISVRDNGRGMSLEGVTNAISAGWTSNGRHGSLGLFGMGFNISTARLGRHTTVRTSRAGDPDWVEVALDLPAIASAERYQAPYRLVPKNNADEHGTTVTVGELKADQFDLLRRPGTQAVIREKLGDIYGYLLDQRGFILTINDRKVAPRIPCLWDESRHVTRQGVDIGVIQYVDQPLPERKACMDCGYWSQADADRCEECGQSRLQLRQRRIHGWLGVQRYVHKTDYGVDFLRNGRKILTKDKRVFYWQPEDELGDPELEYPIDAKTPTGRIVGEIHCDHVAPNYQKTAFEFDTHEWHQVMRAVRGTSPLRPEIAKRLHLPRNESPLARLYAGFRRQDAGLNYLIPGDGERPLHAKAVEWAGRFRANDPDYQSDEKWYQAAYQHDHPVNAGQEQGDDGEIIPGIEPVVDEGKTAQPGRSPNHGEIGQNDQSTETVSARLRRYRESAQPIVDLNGHYTLPDMASVELSAWLVRKHRLNDSAGRPSPVVAYMTRAPSLEVFVDADADLFQRQGADIRDLALVEVAEFMRVRAKRMDASLTELVSQLKAAGSAGDLTPKAIADEAERILDLVRLSMVRFVADDPARHWEVVSEAERIEAQRRFALEVAGMDTWDDQIGSGEFVRYLRGTAVVRIIKSFPESFFDGRVFTRVYSAVHEQSTRDLVMERVVNPLGDLALLEEHRPRLELEELARARSSCRLIIRYLADSP